MSLGSPAKSTSNIAYLFTQQQEKLLKSSNRRIIAAALAGSTGTTNEDRKFSYRPCPICQKKLVVRMNGVFVYKWISSHFSSNHHEWMHIVVNLHGSL